MADEGGSNIPQVNVVLDELHSGDIADLERINKIQNDALKINTVLYAWTRQQNQERKLRKNYAYWILAGIFIQAIFIDILIIMLGRGVLVLENWIVSTTIITIFLEIVGLATVVVQYLFPKKDSEILNIIKDL